MRKLRLWFVVVLLSFTGMLRAQGDVESIIAEVVEELADNYDEDTDFSALTDRLYYLAENPISINQGTAEQLRALPFLTQYQVNQILSYRRQYGGFTSIFELAMVEGVDKENVLWMIPFVTLQEESASILDKRMYARHDLIVRTSRVLQNQKGYTDSAGYIGDPYRNYLRYSAQVGNIEGGITADKDPGEPFFTDHNAEGFDFYSFHLFMESEKWLHKVAVGDFSLRYGQGLNLWSGFSMGKATPTSGAMKAPNGIRPYRSAGEGSFFRGVATSFKASNWTLDLFYSSRKLDGNIDYLDDSTDYVITSIDEGGYHRTENELEDENSLDERLLGVNLQYNHEGMHIGLTGYNSDYSHAIVPADQLYNKYRFSGDASTVKGADFLWTMKMAEWYGELSLDHTNHLAYLLGANFYLHPRMLLYLQYRNYHEKYNNLYAAATGESSRNNNEKGWLYGLRLDVHENWFFNGTFDYFTSPWFSYGTDTPQHGFEMSGKMSYIPQRSAAAYIKFFYEEKEVNVDSDGVMNQTDTRERVKVRLHFDKKVDFVQLRSRIERSKVNSDGETSRGFLYYQDVIVEVPKTKLKLYGRYAFFETDDYDSRLYAYENDALYSFSFPAYYYDGNRYYIMVKYKWQHLDFWLRYAETRYRNKTTILSGLNAIDGNVVSEVKLQVRWRF